MSDDSKKKVEEPKPKEPKGPEVLAPAAPEAEAKIVVVSKGKRAHVRRWRFTKEPTEILVAELDAADKAALIGTHPDPSVIVRKVG